MFSQVYLIEKCIENKVSEFIFTALGSVYGVKKEEMLQKI